MRKAIFSHNFVFNTTKICLITGNTIGYLFIKTDKGGNLIYQAMLARGYQG
ncbi:MAG: hypothetical protein ACQJCO_02430 [cyanobacterium endosymbiont of Rhopalodia sterrenbergii]